MSSASTAVGPVARPATPQIGRDARDFASGLRDALREDPDVLLVGEMRDPETIRPRPHGCGDGSPRAGIHPLQLGGSADRAHRRLVLARARRADPRAARRLAPRHRRPAPPPARPRGGRLVAVEVLRGTHAVARSSARARPRRSLRSSSPAGVMGCSRSRGASPIVSRRGTSGSRTRAPRRTTRRRSRCT